MFNCTPLCQFLNEEGEIFPSKTANPPVQYRFDILPVIELQHSVDHLRYGPVLLEAVAFYTQTVPFRDMGLPESTHPSGNLVLALVVVDEPGFMFLKRGVVIAFLAKDKGFGGSGVSGSWRVEREFDRERMG